MTRFPLRLSCALIMALSLSACATIGAGGSGETGFEQARAAYLAQEYPRAYALLQREAELGNPHAQYTLGYMYYYGQGVQPDMERALQWIRKAAAQGDPRAIEALSVLATANLKPKKPLRPGGQPGA
jgi:TPR repeat protein